LVATLLGEGRSKIKPSVDDALEAGGENKSYKGVNPDQKSWPFMLRVLRTANPPAK